MARGPIEGKGATPVMTDQHDIIERKSVEPSLKIARVIFERIGDIGLSRPAHADEIGGEAADRRGDSRHNMPPQIG